MNNSRYYKRMIVRERINSQALAEDRVVKVFLPPGYDEYVSYPVIYCQDGDDFFRLGRIATHATQLILDEGLDPMIIVGVDVDKRIRWSEYDPSGPRFDAYKQFFVNELLPYVESRFPARPSPVERILAGDSLGGTVSLHLALDFPDKFHKLLSLSGAFLESTRSRIARESELSWLTLYMLIGLEEHNVVTKRGNFDLLAANREASRLLKERNARIEYVEKNGKHIWGFWQNELPAAFRFFFKSAYTL
ncbi:alpha/beta hydrolase [Ferviditalea candida]|uniref:Alpha/beta hydrolase-fold protein n=1 Tax=Ferviditalea candida TaxID=3108399 RepID=A0ABU5ZJQ0_9BACL|nr:alpha/beta hydrolase-fold protein [Paenibacillaceae bacterium T2]